MAISRPTRVLRNRTPGTSNNNPMKRHSFRAGLLSAFLVFTAGLASTDVSAQGNGAQSNGAQNNGQRITPHFKDAEIGQVIEAVAAATGKTIIPDIRVRAQVTMLSTTP